MSKWRVCVEKNELTLGFIEVEAEGIDHAFDIVSRMDKESMEDEAEWGSCGDYTEIEATYDIDPVYEPTVSEGLWK